MIPSSSDTNKTLFLPVQYLKGVGPRLAEVFAKKNIHTLWDLIHWLPRTYIDRRIVEDLSQLEPGSYATLYGYIAHKKSQIFKNKKRLYDITVNAKGGVISCKYFHFPYRGYFDSFEIDQKVKVVGKVTYYRGRPEFHHPDIYPFKKEEDEQQENLIPVYTEIEKISQNKIRKIIRSAFEKLKESESCLILDPLPDWLKKEQGLISKKEALEQMHFPQQDRVTEYLRFRSPAHKRLIFEDFFLLQLYMGMKKKGFKKEKTHPIFPATSLSDKLKSILSFSLTQAQERVLNDIYQDIQKDSPMHRLIQGDVGSGKTIVALLAVCPFIEQGFQCTVMAPTEILAEQHYNNMSKLLEPLGVKISLLTGKTKAKEKRNILEKLATGYISLCIGTHALIQESVQFYKLALVVVDEQHRFGVHQRGLLKAKGVHPHFLVMTATPIPRSLAMTLYGDLDVSIIDEMPKGRKKIITKKTYSSKREKVFSFLADQIQAGRQAYIVYPLVEESESLDLKNATGEYEKLKLKFPEFKIGLLHGRLSGYEKQEMMAGFVKGEIQILASTTVIEVGVDVANANLMIIEHAERFGLSQLHQLRGRVGRGAFQSYCVLILSGGFSEEAVKRLSIMEQTSDGFKIAEEDLEIRGPGEFLGTKQSGLPEFKIANLIRDGSFLQKSKTATLSLIEKDPDLIFPEQQILKQEIEKLSQKLLPG